MKPTAISFQAIRFVGTGAANTIFSLALYQGLVFVFPYKVSYTLAFAAGIAFAILANSKVVFSTELTLIKVLRFTLTYIALYIVGVLMTILLVEYSNFSERLAPLMAAGVLLPISFFGSRWALLRRTGAATISTPNPSHEKT